MMLRSRLHGDHNRPTPNASRSAYDGLILAACFFAPLIGALNAEVFFLHWSPRATAGAMAAFAIVSGVAAGMLTVAARLRSPRAQVAAALALSSVPVAALAFTLLRFVPWKDALIDSAADPGVRLLVSALGAAGAALALARPAWTLVLLRVGRVAMTPVLLVTLATFGRLAFGGVAVPASAVGPTSPRGAAVSQPHVLVLVFDELSFAYVYRGRDIAPELPNLGRFGLTARHHFDATAPGGQTLEAMPGYLAVTRFHDVDVRGDQLLEVGPDGRRVALRLGPDNLFARARAAGYRTELFGTYLPYCDLLSTVVDRCAAYSIYNTNSLTGGMSPLDAIRTSLILLPRQFPTGFLKNPPFAAYQRDLADRLEVHALEPLRHQPTFRFVHFSVPHSPFVFTESGYDPPADPLADNEERYRRQLVYVDGLIGRILERLESSGMRARTTVAITSDHEWRSVTPRARWSHVPLLVRQAGQQVRETEAGPVRAEQVLAGLTDRR
jgi:hypothetical protein